MLTNRLFLLTCLTASLSVSSSCSSNPASVETPTRTVSSNDTASVDKQLVNKAAIAASAYKIQLEKDIADHESRTFTPDQLLRKAKANNGYVGKRIYLEGEIKRVSKDAIGDSYAFFKSNDKAHTVKASLRGPLAARLTKSQKVTLTGRCLGFILSDLLLDDTYEASDLSSLKDNLKNL